LLNKKKMQGNEITMSSRKKKEEKKKKDRTLKKRIESNRIIEQRFFG